MKHLINQFDTNEEMIKQLAKDMKLLSVKGRIVNATSFFDDIGEKHTSIIFYYE